MAETITLTMEEAAIIRKALDMADDALGSLKRFNGHEVTSIVLPALNEMSAALVVLTQHDVTQDIWATEGQSTREVFRSPWVINCRDEDAAVMRAAFEAHGIPADANPGLGTR